VRGTRVLFIKAEGAGDALPATLHEIGATMDEIVAFQTVPDASGGRAARDALALNGVDAITFTSASTVRFFLDALDANTRAVGGALVITMGPVTSAAARALGLTVRAEAATATVDALIDAVIDALR